MSAKERIVGLSSSYADIYPVEVVGESSYRSNIEEICGYYDEAEGYKDDSHVAYLYLDDINPYDPNNAVRVAINDLTVGYLKKNDAATYRVRLKALNAPENAIGLCHASISGGFRKRSGEIADFGVRLDFYLEDFTLEHALYMDERIYPTQVTHEPEVNAAIPAAAPLSTEDKAGQPEKLVKRQSSKTWLVVFAAISIVLGGIMAVGNSSTFTEFLTNGVAYPVVIFGLLLLGRWFIVRRKKKTA